MMLTTFNIQGWMRSLRQCPLSARMSLKRVELLPTTSWSESPEGRATGNLVLERRPLADGHCQHLFHVSWPKESQKLRQQWSESCVVPAEQWETCSRQSLSATRCDSTDGTSSLSRPVPSTSALLPARQLAEASCWSASTSRFAHAAACSLPPVTYPLVAEGPCLGRDQAPRHTVMWECRVHERTPATATDAHTKSVDGSVEGLGSPSSSQGKLGTERCLTPSRSPRCSAWMYAPYSSQLRHDLLAFSWVMLVWARSCLLH